MSVFAGMAHRLLLETAQAHEEGIETLGWPDLAERAGDDTSYKRVNRALRHLADEGLIEGVSTSSGWFRVRATPRGYAKVRRELERNAMRGPVPEATGIAAIESPLVTRLRALDQRLGDEARALDHKVLEHSKIGAAKVMTTAGPVAARAAQQARERLNAARGQVALAWHTLTTFP